MATLGMYEPAAFLEEAPMMFYALEEDIGYKVPVVFIHGIDGSVLDFLEIVAQLDRKLYKPWFFFYPSGNGLEQLGEMFYKIFLSGKTIPLPEMLGENSDGVVPLSSQLCREAQEESTVQFGFNDTHTGILTNPEAIRHVLTIVESIKPPFPEDHLAELLSGGYQVTLVGD